MLAVLRYLILAILLITVLRHLIGFIARLFLNATVGPERRNPEQHNVPPSGPAASVQEALKKDPVCGTFVAPSTAVHVDRSGQTYYFCSAACRDKF